MPLNITNFDYLSVLDDTYLTLGSKIVVSVPVELKKCVLCDAFFLRDILGDFQCFFIGYV